jgi:predicted ribosomally synthesized peptide with SipW-like signal peptide
MSDKKIELNRRRVLGGIVTVGAAAAAAGAGTFAAFSDTEESTGNTIQAGTLDLGGATASGFGLTNMAPGDTTSVSITSTYSGSIGATIAVDSVTLNDSDGTPNDTPISATDFAKYLKVTAATLSVGGDSTNILSGLSDGNSNGRVDLADLASNAPYTATATASDSDNVDFSVTLEFVDESNQNDAQADGVDVDVTLGADQA